MAIIFANVLGAVPEIRPEIRQAGEATARACVVGGQRSVNASERERRAIAEAFESHLSQSLANIQAAERQLLRAERNSFWLIIAASVTFGVLLCVPVLRRLRRRGSGKLVAAVKGAKALRYAA